MNYYLLFGLTFLMCLVVTVIYMPKYNFKEVAICILVWTIIGTMGMAAFILAFPKDKPPVKTVDTITNAQPAEVKPEDVEIPIDTSSGDARVFHDKFEAEYKSGNATSVQKAAILDKYSDRLVRWTGSIHDVNGLNSDLWSVMIDIGDNDTFTAWFEKPSKETQTKLTSLHVGEEITVEGTTNMMIFSWSLDNAKIIE